MFEQPLQHLYSQYSIRVSARAKYMRLNLSLERGLVVVIPKSMSQYQAGKMIPDFVKQQQEWISRSLKKLQKKKNLRPVFEQCPLPETIQLRALQETFSITYIAANDSALILEHKADQHLCLCGPIDNKKSVFNVLEDFFKQYARFYLQQRLDELSEQLNLPYNRLTVRAQKTRWGSCSSRKNINLNYRLIFIEKYLLDYVLTHELLHTTHMNHAKEYWSELDSIIPNSRMIDKQLNQITKSLPCWIFHQ